MHFNKGKAYGRQGKAPKGVKFAEALLLITQETPCKVAKLTETANLTKMVNLAGENGKSGNLPWFGKCSN